MGKDPTVEDAFSPNLMAVLIAAAEPPLNRQGGTFGRGVGRYLQVRDERLGLSEEQMLRRLCREHGILLK